jgi:hypothetical protein
MRLRATLVTLLVAASAACSAAPSSNVDTSASAVGSFPGCSGSFNTQPSPTGSYYATDFGCSSDPEFTDPGDTCGSAACISSAFSEGLCSSGESNAECQRAVNWYSIGGASYGCGARLRVENPANGKSVIVIVLDNGPSCAVENEAGYWVLDVSYPTIMYLFGSEEGYSDHALINVSVVSRGTPLGPTTGGSTSPPPPESPTSCTTSSGASGVCIATSACAAEGGKSTAGDCPGAADIQCCTMSQASPVDAGSPPPVDAGSGPSLDAGYGTCTTSSGESGVCTSTSACASSGGSTVAGDCPGPADIQCCTSAGEASGGLPDAGYGSCTTASGTSGECVSTSTCSAHGGTSTSDECPGPADIQCCTGAS